MREDNLLKIGQTLGIAKDEIKNTIKRRKNLFIMGAVFSLALASMYSFYHLGTEYGGISWEDFEFFKNKFFFRFLSRFF